jgi:hypothetical protein
MNVHNQLALLKETKDHLESLLIKNRSLEQVVLLKEFKQNTDKINELFAIKNFTSAENEHSTIIVEHIIEQLDDIIYCAFQLKCTLKEV